MRIVRFLLAIVVLAFSAAALRAQGSASCPEGKRITTEKAAIEYARQLFTQRQKLIRRVAGAGIDAIARNLSGDCCEVTKDQRGWHVDLMDKRDNPRTIFSFSFDECGTAVESKHNDK